MARYKRLGDILISESIITEKQLEESIIFQAIEGGKLGEILIKLGYLSNK